jgi:cytochrome c556
MGVHIDEMSSEVTGEADSPAAGAAQPAIWEEMAHIREIQAQLARDRFRRAAEGYDD